jgi:hypothetical protein
MCGGRVLRRACVRRAGRCDLQLRDHECCCACCLRPGGGREPRGGVWCGAEARPAMACLKRRAGWGRGRPAPRARSAVGAWRACGRRECVGRRGAGRGWTCGRGAGAGRVAAASEGRLRSVAAQTASAPLGRPETRVSGGVRGKRAICAIHRGIQARTKKNCSHLGHTCSQACPCRRTRGFSPELTQMRPSAIHTRGGASAAGATGDVRPAHLRAHGAKVVSPDSCSCARSLSLNDRLHGMCEAHCPAGSLSTRCDGRHSLPRTRTRELGPPASPSMAGPVLEIGCR